MHNKKYPILLILFLGFLIGLFSVLNIGLIVVVLGIILYLSLVYIFINENNIKKIIPYLLILLLLQDTITQFLNYYFKTLGDIFSYIDELFVVVCLPALIINFFRGKPIKGKLVISVLLIILVFGSLSSLVNLVPLQISLQGALLMTKGLIFLLIFCNISFTQTDIQRYVSWIKYFTIVIMFFAVVDLLFSKTFRAILHTDTFFDVRFGGFVSVISLFIHPGIYGWYMTFISAYMIATFKVIPKYKYLMIGCLIILFAVLSFRFKVILAICVMIFIVYLLMGLKKVLAFSIFSTVLIGILFLISGDLILGLAEMTLDRYINAEMTDSARKALYIVSFLIGYNEFPFGTGFGRFAGHISRVEYSPVYYEYGINNVYGLRPEAPSFVTDTYWPNILGEVGYIGAATLLLFFLHLAFYLLKNYNYQLDKKIKILVLFSGLILVQGLIESLGAPVFNASPQNVFIFISLGISLSVLESRKPNKKSNSIVKNDKHSELRKDVKSH